MKSGSAAAATTTAAAAAEGGEDMKGNENKSTPTTPTTASNNSQWYSLCDSDEKGWKELAMPVIKAYDERTDGAMIEDKEYGIVWKFEGADPDYGQMQAREMQKYLMELIADDVIDIVVYDDNRILEILPKGVNKGLTTSLLIDTLRSYMKDPLFLMAVGDDVSDEKMFSALQNSPVLQRDDLKYEIVTCCVGLKPSQAHYYAHDPEEVRESLRELALVAEQMSPSSTWTNQNSDSGMALGGGGGFQRTGGGGFGRSGNLAGLARSGGF